MSFLHPLRKYALPIASVLLAGLVYLLNAKLIHIYSSLPFLAGADGAGHWSIGEYYSAHIFPKTWGWIPVWFGGMPFPQFYPPFFYFFNALLAHLLPWFSYLSVTKGIVLTSIFAVPAVSIWMAYQICKSKSGALLVGILSTLMLCVFGTQSGPGFTVEAAINKGFVTQFFALAPILLCLGFTANIRKSKRARFGAGITFALILLTNVHTAILLFILISFIGLVDIYNARAIADGTKYTERRNTALLYLKIFGLAGFACSFWFIPLVTSYDYFSTVPLAFDWKYVSVGLRFIIGISFPIAGIIAYHKKNAVMLGIILGICLILALADFKVDQKFPGLPLHIYRWLALLPYISMLVLGYIFTEIHHLKFKIGYNVLIFLAFVGIITGTYWKELNKTSDNGIFFAYDATHTDDLVDFLAKRPGLTVVGTEQDFWRSGSFVIDSKLGLAGVPTITHIIRESAPNGLFLTPVRNSFGSRAEMAGVRTYLGRNTEFLGQPMTDKVRRARALGIRYIVVSDQKLKAQLGTSSEVSKIATFGIRDIFEIKDFRPTVTVLSKLPTLVITPLNFKVRPASDYNFTSLNEQAFLQKAYPDVLFARSPEEKVDHFTSTELSRFSSLMITEYSYDDLEIAYAKLSEFSKTKPLILIAHANPLYQRLERDSIHNKNISTFADPKNPGINYSFKRDMGLIFKALTSTTTVASNTGNTPYYIRQTYFPWWSQADTNQKLYAVSPFYTLSFSDPASTEGKLQFNTPLSVKIGYSIFILICGLVVMGTM